MCQLTVRLRKELSLVLPFVLFRSSTDGMRPTTLGGQSAYSVFQCKCESHQETRSQTLPEVVLYLSGHLWSSAGDITHLQVRQQDTDGSSYP